MQKLEQAGERVGFTGRHVGEQTREPLAQGRLSLPGGALEAGESEEEAVIREAAEETGIVVRVHHLIGSYGLDNGFSAAAFLCSITQGDPAVPASGEISEVRWWPAAQLPWPRSNLLHYSLPDAVAGRRNVQRVGLPRVS